MVAYEVVSEAFRVGKGPRDGVIASLMCYALELGSPVTSARDIGIHKFEQETRLSNFVLSGISTKGYL